VINLNNKKKADPFTELDLLIASAIADQISSVIEKFYSCEYSEAEYKEFINLFANLIDAARNYHKKDGFIQDLTVKIMNFLGASDEEKKAALYISKIYDLGLELVDDNIMKKKKLAPSDITCLQVHPYVTVDLINKIEISDDIKKAILHHHEYYDGTGYPDKLKGESIPFLSRVLSVVDSFYSMTSDRIYRKALTQNQALSEIKKSAGSVYDPRVVDALEKVL
jgi:response regulator RpfG family c-di-GMP phosphodiesterase